MTATIQRVKQLEIRGHDEDRKCRRETPACLLTLDSIVTPMGMNKEFARPFKSFVIETLWHLRDHGPTSLLGYEAAGTPAGDWAESHGYIEAVYANQESWRVEIIFCITDEGLAFLREHEAPAEW